MLVRDELPLRVLPEGTDISVVTLLSIFFSGFQVINISCRLYKKKSYQTKTTRCVAVRDGKNSCLFFCQSGSSDIEIFTDSTTQ